jgi:hypothetical protein
MTRHPHPSLHPSSILYSRTGGQALLNLAARDRATARRTPTKRARPRPGFSTVPTVAARASGPCDHRHTPTRGTPVPAGILESPNPSGGRRKSLAAKHQPIARHHTRRRRSTDRTSRATAFPGQPFNALSISRFCVQERRKGPQGMAISGDGVIEASANGEGAVLYCPENGTPRASTSFLR